MHTRKACGVLLLAMAMAYCIAACASEGGSSFRVDGDSNRYGGLAPQSEAPAEPRPSAVPRPSDAPFRVDIFWHSNDDTYLWNICNAVEEALGTAPNVKNTPYDKWGEWQALGTICDTEETMGNYPKYEAAERHMVEVALAEGADLIIVHGSAFGRSPSAAHDVCDMAKAAGAPIIFAVSEVADSVLGSYDKCFFVGTDDYWAGYAQDEETVGKMAGAVPQDATGIAECIALIASNVANGEEPMSNTGMFTDGGEDAAKVLIQHAAVEPRAPTDPPADGSKAFMVDVFWYSHSDVYNSKVRDAMEGFFAETPNIGYTMAFCENDQAYQTRIVKAAIAAGTDLLAVDIVAAWSEEAAQEICDLAKEAGVPIIFFGREVPDSVVNSYDDACFVGVEIGGSGYAQGQAAAEFLLKDGNLAKFDLDGDKEISYVMFRGEHGNEEAYFRTLYSVMEANRLLEGSGYKLVPSPANEARSPANEASAPANEPSAMYPDDGISNFYLYGNWSAPEAALLMRAALLEHRLDDGTIELVLANNDDMAIGAIEAMNEAGYNTGEDGAGYIPVFGIDALAISRQDIEAGKMTGTVMQDARGLAECVALLASNVANGQAPMSDTGRFTNIDPGSDKVRIPYVVFDGRP